MRRLITALVCGVACACATAAPASAASPVPGSAAKPRAQLQGFACQRALNPSNRTVSVRAVMRPLPGTHKLSLKFGLLERTPGSPMAQTVMGAAGLNTWISPENPTLGQLPGDVWRFNKVVYNLDAPADYRFRVSFRWTGAHGKVLGTAVRSSPRCFQRELRPDLLVQSIAVDPIAGQSNEDLYTAVIANQGGSKAGPFEVLFTPGDGSNPETQTVGVLHPGEMRSESFVGPVCNASEPPTVTVDATDEVDDSNRANNELAATCPSAAPS